MLVMGQTATIEAGGYLMPAPLIWLGAGLAALYAGDKLSKRHLRNKQMVTCYPGESIKSVHPKDGSIVCCGIYGVFDHTGIWVDGNIIELRGNGLVRAISPDRFLDNRSGNEIFVLCDEDNRPLISETGLTNASNQLYSFSQYDVLSNNCHRFVWQCVSDKNQIITSFFELNKMLSIHFEQSLNWHLLKY